MPRIRTCLPLLVALALGVGTLSGCADATTEPMPVMANTEGQGYGGVEGQGFGNTEGQGYGGVVADSSVSGEGQGFGG